MIARAIQGFKAAETKEALSAAAHCTNTYAMHLLSSIGGTREEQLCILSAVLLWGVVAWLFTVRAARKTNTNISANDNNLEAPLLEEDEPKHAIRSRVRLPSRPPHDPAHPTIIQL